MVLTEGTKLGQYEIRELIGKGGMGEVYRARDTKLERDVALKLLPEAFARDPERVARFKREAKLLASLNHPNIAAIYDLEESAGRHFLVMELVEGATLAERIHPSRAREQAVTSSGPSPVPVEEALDIASQICEALEHAHEKTVIHRDLKPANVKVTPEGLVKVLDFGLAKAFAGAASGGESPTPVIDSNSPTLSKLPAGYGEISVSPTLPGVILGTAAYMSPEQARGKKVDRRTDIWALGCVLYELLTGHGAFRSHPNRARQQAVKQSPERPLPLRGGETPERRGRQPHGVAS
ncbi:MAG: serine/threonine protein kinase, partial [Acidobacteria bacterium]|nr:serine/threonine protein kinase [Acidobacteriota bacterium]